jgi:NAD(P)-dependent dehydrogenase (short-subunit alcohol dehydrogenase family)
MEDVTSEFWDERMALNLKHYFFAIQAVAPAWRRRRRQHRQHGLGELDARAAQPGGLHHGQGRHPGPDAHAGA